MQAAVRHFLVLGTFGESRRSKADPIVGHRFDINVEKALAINHVGLSRCIHLDAQKI
jgi:hypothetical protein